MIITEIEGNLLGYFWKTTAICKWRFEFRFHQQIMADDFPEQGVRPE
jgi:hypothetical protein